MTETTTARVELVGAILAADERARAAERGGDGPAEHAARVEADALRDQLGQVAEPATLADVAAYTDAASVEPSTTVGGYVVQLPDGRVPGYVYEMSGKLWGAELAHDGEEVTRTAPNITAAVRALAARALGVHVEAPATFRPTALTDRRDGYQVRPMPEHERPTVEHAAAYHARRLADAEVHRTGDALAAAAVALHAADAAHRAAHRVAAAAWDAEQAVI